MATERESSWSGPLVGALRRVATQTSTQKLLINAIALLAIVVIFAIASDAFLTPTNIANVLRQVAPVAITAVAVTLLMVARGLDLSVGGVVSLAGCVAALSVSFLPVPVAFALGVLVGAVVGALNGLLVVGLGINSVIATLGTMYITAGAANIITGGTAVYGTPDGYNSLGAGTTLGLPTPIWIMIAAIVLFLFIQRSTVLGRFATAVGSNTDAAWLAGVPSARVSTSLYILAGAFAGLSGIVMSSRLDSGQPNVGTGFEFAVIVAVVLGGTSLAGGEGTVGGTVLGALIVGILGNGLNLLGVASFWQVVAQGIVLILAVGLDAMLRTRMRNRIRRTKATT